jgi:Na+/glutamate symporter
MKHGHTIIYAFAALSITALSLWAIHDLWVVLLVLFCIAGVHALVTSKR